MVEPEEMVHPEAFRQQGLHRQTVRSFAAPVRVEQALRRGEQRALAVRFDAAAFQFKVQAVHILPVEQLPQAGVDGVVLGSLEFPAPAVEAEVQEFRSIGAHYGKETMVACPRVVRGTLLIYNMVCRASGQLLVDEAAHLFGVRCHNEQRLARSDFKGQAQVAGRHFVEHIGPVRILVRPRQLHAALRHPFRSQRAPSHQGNLLGQGDGGENVQVKFVLGRGGERCLESHGQGDGLGGRECRFGKRRCRGAGASGGQGRWERATGCPVGGDS